MGQSAQTDTHSNPSGSCSDSTDQIPSVSRDRKGRRCRQLENLNGGAVEQGDASSRWGDGYISSCIERRTHRRLQRNFAVGRVVYFQHLAIHRLCLEWARSVLYRVVEKDGL